MAYYALTNTADPRTGFISIGEVLTDAQAAALGEDKLKELVACRVLAVCGEKPQAAAPSPAPTGSAEGTPEETPEEAPEEMPEEVPEDDDELPELELGDDIVNDQPKEKPNKGNGRKA